jgi:hypothetical protein
MEENARHDHRGTDRNGDQQVELPVPQHLGARLLPRSR